jgi:hypothetical protein
VQNFRPYQVLIFVILVLSLLFIPSFLLPNGGAKFLGIKWQFLPFEEVLQPKKQEKKPASYYKDMIAMALKDHDEPKIKLPKSKK